MRAFKDDEPFKMRAAPKGVRAGVLDRTSSGAAETARAAQPHHGALDFTRTRHRDLDKLTGMRVAIVWHALGTDDLESFGDLWRGELDDHAFLTEVGEHLTANQEAVLPVFLFAVHILPGAESLDNSG